MNKTVKTIAWICVVLGLLGVALDVGVYIRGRAFVAQMRESMEAGDFPIFKGRFADTDENGDIDEEDLQEFSLDRDGWFHGGGILDGRRSFAPFSNSRGRLPHLRGDSFSRSCFVLPFLFLTSGPVLAVVGAVILIVNRELKVKDEKEKKEKSKKK